ncbi:MAG: STN domain-containing protein, partial [Planctomycetota bacterium]|nr:STN domain-containing protein [Planctomycetota bacterium]
DGAKALTLKIKSATLKQATDYLGTQLGLEFDFSEKASEKLEERIAIDVTDVSLEELLQEVLKPLDLTFEIKDQRVSIQPVP